MYIKLPGEAVRIVTQTFEHLGVPKGTYYRSGLGSWLVKATSNDSSWQYAKEIPAELRVELMLLGEPLEQHSV
jgi:hypothetical protein